MAMAWEVDRTCVKLAQARLPWLRHRGDLATDSAQAVAAEISKVDPGGRCMVILTAAPPCQDFSRIGAQAGHAGARGSLFLQAVNFLNDLKEKIGERPVGFLFENVVMEPKEATPINQALGVEPVLVCASDFGWVSRPRLWWLSAPLQDLAVDPASGRPLDWTKQGS